MGILSKLFNKESNENISNAFENLDTNYEPGEFKIDDVFEVRGRGTVLTGTVTSGSFTVGDRVFINDISYRVIGLEKFRKKIKTATNGEMVGMLIDNSGRNKLNKGDIIRK